MKEIKDFQEAAKRLKIFKWIIHNCSMCGYPCGFIIRGDEITYDNGCNCVWGGERPSNWQEIADSYNSNAGSHDAQERFNKNPRFGEVIKEQNDFWGFSNPEWLVN